MTVELIYRPGGPELMLFKRCIWVTSGKTEMPKKLPSRDLIQSALRARHSPIRVLNYGFLIKGIPSNISVHLARHVHAVPFVSSLRNDRQNQIDGDNAPRNTPVDMIYYCNAEELMVIANKRLCGKASAKTREVVGMMCAAAEKATPELKGLLVPMCMYHGGKCYELKSCGYNASVDGHPMMQCRNCRHKGDFSCPMYRIDITSNRISMPQDNWFCANWEVSDNSARK